MIPRRKICVEASPEPLPPRLAEFERVYRGQFGAIAAYFARRCAEPQLVADLTADTFVAAIRSFDERDPARTSDRAWTIGVARRVYARYRESDPRESRPGGRGSAQQLLDRAETKELMWWIDVERSSRELMERLAPMSVLDREAVELVDLCGLTAGGGRARARRLDGRAARAPRAHATRACAVKEVAVSRFEDRLWAELVEQHGAAARRAARPGSRAAAASPPRAARGRRARARHRPRGARDRASGTGVARAPTPSSPTRTGRSP